MKTSGPWTIERRAGVFSWILAAGGVIVALAYLKVMILDPRPPQQTVQATQERGPIYDRYGRLLALSTQADTLTLWGPHLDKDQIPQTVQILAQNLGLDPQEWTKKLQNETGFAYVKRKLSPQESQAVTPLVQNGTLKGFSLEKEFIRSYPEKHLGSQVVGYVNLDNLGIAGLEAAYDQDLAAGARVWSTLDTNLAYFVKDIGAKAWKDNQPDGLNILVAEAHTGEVLAYESLPDYDPNHFKDFSDFQRVNHAAVESYEPGSVFKVFSIASLLDSGKIKTEDHFFCNGAYEKTLSSGEVIRIGCMAAHGDVTPQTILKFSCNAGAAYASDQADPAGFEAALRNLGFGKAVDLPLPLQSNGILKPWKTWSARSKPTIAFGQEIGVSGLQILQAATVLANGGQLVKPQLVKKITDPQGQTLREISREVLRPVLKEDTSNQVLRMLRDTIEEGATVKARIQGIDVAGKTGTAQVLDKTTGRYSEKNYVASILLYLPAQDPKYIIYVTLQNPKGPSYFGGQIAAPVAREVGEKLIRHYGLVKKGDQVLVTPGNTVIPPLAPVVWNQGMPDFLGYPKRSLMPLLGRKDLEVTIKGEGWVVRQSPPPGTPIGQGSQILLELE